MNDPLVTIGLPTYNNAETIIVCLKSIFAQSHTNWELIIINDGSGDDTYQLIKDIDDPRVKVINDGFNKGLIYRLNQIIELSNGLYIARMDGDDIMHPDRIKEQVKYLISHPDVDIVDTGVISMSQEGEPEGIRRMENISERYADTLLSCSITHPAVMGKRSWFIENKYHGQYFRAEDFELWCRTFERSKFSRVVKPLHFFREGNISVSNYLKSSSMAGSVLKKYGPSVIGNMNVYVFLLKSKLKSLIYIILGAMKKQYYLTRTRNNKLTKTQMEEYYNVISNIGKIVIPRKKVNSGSASPHSLTSQ